MAELNPELHINGKLQSITKYGENPWQESAALYATGDCTDPLAVNNFELVGGTAPSFNNYADLDRLLQTVTHVAAGYEVNFSKVPHIAAGAKHGNVCGLAVNKSQEQAIANMLKGDPRAIFGGSILTNFAITGTLADKLITHDMKQGRRLLDVVAAPNFDEDALETLDRKAGKLRMLSNAALGSLTAGSLDTLPRTRHVRGGILVQDNYTYVPMLASEEINSYGPEVSDPQKRDMLLAWAIGSTSNSNTITLVKDGMLIGNGVGQQDRVSAVELAVKRCQDAGHDTTGASAYSDSFFPFPDGPEKLIEAGIEAVFTSSGSVKDNVVFKVFEEAGVSVYAVPDTTSRGFYAH